MTRLHHTSYKLPGIIYSEVIGMEVRTCTTCRETKLIDQFHKDKKSKDGRRPDCKDCRSKQIKEWQSTNADRYKAYQKEYHKNYWKKVRQETFEAYGNICQCCGETHQEFLTIDHIDGTGAAERKTLGNHGGTNFYRWLKKHGYPKDNYRLLCFNCNCAIGIFGYCPHQISLKDTNLDV